VVFTGRREGEACGKYLPCGQGLTCVKVGTYGSFCMTTCTTLDSDPLCNGNETCTSAGTVNVCYNAYSASTGFTSR